MTGASSGIGRATALAFAREGASVVVADVAVEGNRETALMIEQAGGRSLGVSCDVTRGDEVRTALHAAVQRFGRLDIAFNNAGIEQPVKPAAEIGEEEWGPPRTGITSAAPSRPRRPRSAVQDQLLEDPTRFTDTRLV